MLLCLLFCFRVNNSIVVNVPTVNSLKLFTLRERVFRGVVFTERPVSLDVVGL